MRSLTDWLEAPRADAGIHFAEAEGRWSFVPYTEIAARARAVAAQMQDRGVRRGDVVTLALRTGPEFPAAFFGTLLLGATPSPVAPPLTGSMRAGFAERVAGILRCADPRVVVTDEALRREIQDGAARAGIAERVVELASGEADLLRVQPAPGELALLQFTSGSTGSPRGVRISRTNLEANIDSIRRWLAMEPHEGTASWLPLHHDMGLIGCMLTPIVNESSIWLMEPRTFLRNPLLWLERFGRGEAVFTAAPSFGYARAALAVDSERLDGLDFSGWRAAIVGSERIDASFLELLARRLEPAGFRRTGFLPAYGLAEATLVVTGNPLFQEPRVVRPRWSSMRVGDPVEVLEHTQLGKLDGSGWVVGCGVAIPDTRVWIEGAGGEPMPEGAVGEIVVEGRCVADGYQGEGEPTGASRVANGVVHTGDAGFLVGGELFVLGRMGDTIRCRGRTIFLEDLEGRLAHTEGAPIGRYAVLGGSLGQLESVDVLCESCAPGWPERAARAIREQVGRGVGIRVVEGAQGVIQRTSSGKPKRRSMWEQVTSGALELRVHLDWPAASATEPASAAADGMRER